MIRLLAAFLSFCRNVYGLYENLLIRLVQCALLGVVAYFAVNWCVVPLFHLEPVAYHHIVGTLLMVVILKLTWMLEGRKGK